MMLSEKYNSTFSENAITFRENIKCEDQSLIEKKYALCYPIIGKEYLPNMDFLIIGRATNGWKPKFRFNEFDESIIEQSIKFSQSENEGECALEWINRNWLKNQIYRSSFWNVVYKLMIKLGKTDENWTWNIAWSNLMKIAPASGGNPEGFEWEAQYEKSVDLFLMELNELNPKYVLMMTVFFFWAQYFLKRDGFEITRIYDDKFVEAVVNYENTKIIVTSRPERKPQEEFVESVVEHLQ